MSSNSQFQFIKCCIVSSNECSYKSYTSELYSPRIFNIDIPMINSQNAWYFFFIILNMYMVHLFSNNDVALTASILSVKHHNKVYHEVQSPATRSLSVLRNWVVYLYHKMSQKLSTLYFSMVIKWRDIFRWER